MDESQTNLPLYENALLTLLKGEAPTDRCYQLLQSMHFYPDSGNYRLILGRMEQDSFSEDGYHMLQNASQALIQPKCTACHMGRIGKNVVWLIQPAKDINDDWLSSTVELIGQHLCSAEQMNLHFFISPPIENFLLFGEQFKQLDQFALKMNDDTNMLVYIFNQKSEAESIQRKSRIVRQINLCISEGITKGITLSTLSHELGYNPSYLSKLYLSGTKQHISNVISQKKLAAIEELMKNDALSLQDIAQQTGFDTQSYFCRFIRRMTGFTPFQMRFSVLEGKTFTNP